MVEVQRPTVTKENIMNNYDYYLGLGGNIGDVAAHMISALDLLVKKDSFRLKKISSLYRTRAWGYIEQQDFINSCCMLQSKYEPIEVLQKIQQIELILKRERIIKWGPRTIDIDILAMTSDGSNYSKTYSDEKLTIPHPRMLERGFVLCPLCEIAPDLIIDNKKVKDWQEDVSLEGIVKIKGNEDWLLKLGLII